MSVRTSTADTPNDIADSFRNDAAYFKSMAEEESVAGYEVLKNVRSDYGLHKLSNAIEVEEDAIYVDRDDLCRTADRLEVWADKQEIAANIADKYVEKIGEKIPIDANDIVKGYAATGTSGAAAGALGIAGTGDPAADGFLKAFGSTTAGLSGYKMAEYLVREHLNERFSSEAEHLEGLMNNADLEVEISGHDREELKDLTP